MFIEHFEQLYDPIGVACIRFDFSINIKSLRDKLDQAEKLGGRNEFIFFALCKSKI